MRFLATLLGIVMLLLPDAAQALHPEKAFHHYVRDNWSIQQGLPQISALAIAQDRQGYLWVGTQAGLARFDGVRFVGYTPDSESHLPGIWVRALHAGRDGRLWIGTYKGLAVYDGDSFTTVAAADAARWPALDVAALGEDAAGQVWVATTAGVFRVQDGFLHHVAGSPAPAQSLLLRSDGVWVGGRGAAYRLADDRWDVVPLPGDAPTAIVNRLVETQGRVWAATAEGLFARDGGGWQRVEQVAALAHAPIDLLYPDRDGNLWAGGDAGLARIRAGHVAEYVDAASPGGIPGLRVAFEDGEGNLRALWPPGRLVGDPLPAGGDLLPVLAASGRSWVAATREGKLFGVAWEEAPASGAGSGPADGHLVRSWETAFDERILGVHLAAGRVLVRFEAGSLASLDAVGRQESWRVRLSREDRMQVLAHAGALLVLGATELRVHDLASGEVKCQRSVPSPAVGGDLRGSSLRWLDRSGGAHRVDIEDGHPGETADLGLALAEAAPIQGGFVVTTAAGELGFVDVAEGVGSQSE